MNWRELAGPLAARATGDGPNRIVFVHGFTQTGASWAPIAERLAAHTGCESVVVDLPGHGRSGSVRADLRTSADLLAATTGLATYVGYSLGGRVCLHLAMMFPHVVERLVVIGATPGIIDEDERARRRASDEQLAEHVVDVGVEQFIDEWVTQPLFDGLELSAADRAERCTNTAEGLASSLRLAGTGTQLPLWDRLGGLAMPVLVLAGERDERFRAIGERMAASIPRGTFTAIPDAGHAAHLQQPDLVAAAISESAGRRS